MLSYLIRYWSTNFFRGLFLIGFATVTACRAQTDSVVITSPDNKIEVRCTIDTGGRVSYTVTYNNDTVLESSRLGVVRSDGDFSNGLSTVSVSPVKRITDSYQLQNSKRYNNTYTANERIWQVKNAGGQPMDIIFRVSDDGVAFRYYFPGTDSGVKKIDKELTSFHFPAAAKGWLQPMSPAKTGWEQVNPCYEEFYQKGIPAGTPSTLKAGWVFPALFELNNTWVLLTETAMDEHYCGTKLGHESPGGEYSIDFPDPREIFPGGGVNPQSALPWYTPWRIITIGSLATIAESTLGTDLAPAPGNKDYSFAKTGIASWSWAILKDDSTTFEVQKRFVDYAADMHWQYCLVDANWDTQIGYDSIQLLVNYARQKNIGIWLWYNSAGSWNTTPLHPRNKLITHELRVSEFSRLQKMGVVGVKVDFFGGDGQSMMQYYTDIMNDAADHNIMVNFHGATLPRGWQRTYPNFMTDEAIKGFEYITFDQRNADEEPVFCTILPFTRNAFDPMDFTPMSLYKIPRIQRRTTAAFELALPVLFLSGVQHLVEIPTGMSHMPGFVKDFLRELPNHWDDVKFLDGYPGKFVVLARKSGSKWYITGINGSDESMTLNLDLDFTKGKSARFIHHNDDTFFEQQVISLSAGKKQPVTLEKADGFVMVVE